MSLAKVKVLIEGHTDSDTNVKVGSEETQPTVSLVRDGDVVMVVDPGVLDSQNILIEKLAEEGLDPHDVNYVFITHSHLDHYRNVGMFPKAKDIEYFGIWSKNTVKDRSENLTENIRILATPGHDYTSLTLFVNTDDGVVAICGDVFWRENGPEVDVYAQDLQKLEHSRKMVLDIADFVIPGHGAMFKISHDSLVSKNSIRSMLPMNIFSTIKQKLTFAELGVCRKCRKPFYNLAEKCVCQNWLCFNCCECDDDCDQCNCSHKRKH